MTKYMDYTISAEPIRVLDLMVDRSLLTVQSVMILQLGHLPGRTMRRRNAVFEQWAVAYIAGGRGIYQADGGTARTLEAGSVFFVWPGAVFDYGPAAGGSWDEYYIRFEGSRLEEWRSNGLLREGCLPAAEADPLRVRKLEVIFSLVESGTPAGADRAALLLESLLYDFAAGSPEPPDAYSPSSWIAALLDDLSGRVHEPFRASDIAARHHISVSTLRRLIKKHTGYAVHEYGHRLKIAEAKKLLLNTDLPVNQIARMLGYEDPLYFSRLFTRYAGVSAQRFRRNF